MPPQGLRCRQYPGLTLAYKLTNGTGVVGPVPYHAQASRAKAARSAPHFPSVARKSTRWTAMAVTPHPIFLSCRSWQSAQRIWISPVSVRSFRHPGNLLYRHAELLGLVVSLCNQESDIQYQPALVMLGSASGDSLLEELITPGVHLQGSGEL